MGQQKKYVLGIDGGATKTHCAICGLDGNMVDLTAWGPTNHEVMKGGFAELEEELGRLFTHLSVKTGISIKEFKRCVFGLAGIDTKSQHSRVMSIIGRLGIGDFILCNDSYLGIKAGSPEGYGICVVNGTGYSVVGIDPSGRMFQNGGQGAITGDKGGGTYLGTAAVSSVYRFLFKGGEYTSMKDMLFEELRVVSKYSFMEIITDGMIGGTVKISELGKVVFRAANANDAVALRVLEEIGAEYAISVNNIIKELDFRFIPYLPVILSGSVFVKGENPTSIERMQRDIIAANDGIEFRFKILEQPPVMGAVSWALEGGPDGR